MNELTTSPTVQVPMLRFIPDITQRDTVQVVLPVLPVQRGRLDRLKQLCHLSGAKCALGGAGVMLCLSLALVFMVPHANGGPAHSAALTASPTVPQPGTRHFLSSEKVLPAIDQIQPAPMDVLLERAALASESGQSAEALILFRRYSEENPTPAARLMVELLEQQLSPVGRER